MTEPAAPNRRPERHRAGPRAAVVPPMLALLLAVSAASAQAQTPGEAGRALDADASAGPVKVCSPLAMPRWRSLLPVPKTWTFLDCMGFAGQMGATDFQLGCLFAEVTPHAQKFAWGPVVRIEKAALAKAQAPVPNCGW